MFDRPSVRFPFQKNTCDFPFVDHNILPLSTPLESTSSASETRYLFLRPRICDSTDRPFDFGYNATSTATARRRTRRKSMEHFPWWNEAQKNLKKEAQQLVAEVLLPSALMSEPCRR